MAQVCFRSEFRAQELTILCMILTENCVNAASAAAVIDVDYFHRNALPREVVFMITLRHIVPALCLATGAGGIVHAVYAASTAADPPTRVAGGERCRRSSSLAPRTSRRPPGRDGLRAAQTQSERGGEGRIKPIFAEQKSQFEALRASASRIARLWRPRRRPTRPPTGPSSRRRRPTHRPASRS